MKQEIALRTIPCDLILVKWSVSPLYATFMHFLRCRVPSRSCTAVQDEEFLRGRAVASNASLSEHSAICRIL